MLSSENVERFGMQFAVEGRTWRRPKIDMRIITTPYGAEISKRDYKLRVRKAENNYAVR
jgi:hypothetical protein